MEVKAKLEGALTDGISHIAIDKNGKLLAASAMDPNNCIVVYNLVKLLDNKLLSKRPSDFIIATGKGPDTHILDL